MSLASQAKRFRLAVVTNILPPYRVPLFNALAKQEGLDLRVFLCAKNEPNRHWEWPDNILFKYEIGSAFKWSLASNRTIYFNPDIILKIRKYNPDYVLSGSMGLVSLMSWLGARICGAKFILWTEGIIGADGWIGTLMTPVRKHLVRVADGYIASSKTAAKLFEHYGAKKEHIVVSLLTTDTTEFSQSVALQRKNIKILKEEMALSGPVVLYVGNLEYHKGVDLLLRTFIEVLREVPSAHLLIVGSGSYLSKLQSEIALPLYKNVHLVGFMQYSELPQYYAVADLFALFSRRDRFGLVITEAVVSGLPIMCSKYAGAAYDLVDHGVNGYIIDPECIKENAELMTHILKNESQMLEMKNKSLMIAEKCKLEKSVESICDILCRNIHLR